MPREYRRSWVKTEESNDEDQTIEIIRRKEGIKGISVENAEYGYKQK